ncbi:hypothetical protein Anas_09588 [Armadillidium nasatum]|uniref:Uncharacterized protein n=1 Tax=Armadillidium nasatum TaxID=96803 RepID=A0A5N5TNX6_9CRUS|nr:hypothetical protein Anas_09588 [Armadillidium nasatum]
MKYARLPGARIICDNSVDIDEIQPQAFRLPEDQPLASSSFITLEVLSCFQFLLNFFPYSGFPISDFLYF